MLNLGLKAEKQLQNENHTEDWALGSHPRDNGHVTHSPHMVSKKSFNPIQPGGGGGGVIFARGFFDFL